MKSFLRKHRTSLIILVVVIGLSAAWMLMSMKIIYINSGSMEPTMPVGTVAIIKPDATLQAGNIITFLDENGKQVTHTFIGYDVDGTLLTKGDANPTPDVHDPALTEQDVVGTVVRVLTPDRQKLFALFAVIAAALYLWQPGDSKKDEDDDAEEGAGEDLDPESQPNATDTKRVINPA